MYFKINDITYYSLRPKQVDGKLKLYLKWKFAQC